MKKLIYNAKLYKDGSVFIGSLGFDSERGKIIYCGDNYSVQKKDYNELIDAGGKTLLPAFYEGHCHLVKGAMVANELNLRNASTFDDFRNEINKFKTKVKNNGWIYGGYFSETNFTEELKIDRYKLDSICEDIPVVIFRLDLHSAIANTLALELSEIIRKKDKYNSDELIRDEDGELTGEIKERAMYDIFSSFPPLSISEKQKILIEEVKRIHSLGIVSVTDISLKEDLELYKSLFEINNLDIRINSVVPFSFINNISEYFNMFRSFGKIRFGGFKAFYDGSLSSETAYFFDNYLYSDYSGLRTEQVNSGEFWELMKRIDSEGYQCVVHAIGDKAVYEVLKCSEELERLNGKRDRRLRIEHVQHLREDEAPIFADLGVIASVQPTHIFVDGANASAKIANPSTTHSYKKISDLGGIVCFGTDYPVVDINPFTTIYYAMTREAKGFPDGFHTEYAYDLYTSIDAYTKNNAFASFQENITGELKEGLSADFIILENDIFTSDINEIKSIKVSETYFEGSQVY